MSVMGSDLVAVTCIVVGGAVGSAGLMALVDEREEVQPETTCSSSFVITSLEAPRIDVRVRDGRTVMFAPSISSTPTVARLVCDDGSAVAAELREQAVEARERAAEARELAQEARERAEAERREIRELVERVRAQREELRRVRQERETRDDVR